jgi:hypothetical protein
MSSEEMNILTLEDKTAAQSRNAGTNYSVTRCRIPERTPQMRAVEA